MTMPYELKVIFLMVAIPVGPFVLYAIWRVARTIHFRHCCECGKPILPLTASRMCPDRHEACQRKVLSKMMLNPKSATIVMREIAQWNERGVL